MLGQTGRTAEPFWRVVTQTGWQPVSLRGCTHSSKSCRRNC